MERLENYPKVPLKNSKDLTGKRFGRLVCLYKTINRSTSNSSCWVCQCDCGNITAAASNSLQQGATVSCGCYNREAAAKRLSAYNLKNKKYYINIGDRFGKLSIIKSLGLKQEHGNTRNKKEEYFLCKCDCGNVIETTKSSLVNGRVKSCGCLHSWGEAVIQELLDKNNIRYKHEYSFKDLVNPKTGRRLKYDFAVLNEDNSVKLLIEVDGRQHFTGPEGNWKNSYTLEEQQERDALKNNYASKHNIPLKRFVGKDINKITINDIVS